MIQSLVPIVFVKRENIVGKFASPYTFFIIHHYSFTLLWSSRSCTTVTWLDRLAHRPESIRPREPYLFSYTTKTTYPSPTLQRYPKLIGHFLVSLLNSSQFLREGSSKRLEGDNQNRLTPTARNDVLTTRLPTACIDYIYIFHHPPNHYHQDIITSPLWKTILPLHRKGPCLLHKVLPMPQIRKRWSR